MIFDSCKSKKKKVAIVGGGAAGMACAWSLSRHPDMFEVTVLESLSAVGGVASTCEVGDACDAINDQVQGGAPSYRNNMLFFKEAAGATVKEVEFKIAFGRGEHAWKNYGDPSPMVLRLQKEIERFGKVLKTVFRFEFFFVFVPIHRLLSWYGFSKEFQERMVFPLTALFFGTGNQTPYVSAAVIARVFLDPELRLFEYSKTSLLDEVPTMFAFPKLGDIFSDIAKSIKKNNGNNRILTSAPVTKIERRKSGIKVHSPVFETQGGAEEFDEIVMCCGAERAIDILGDDASWRERKFLKNVKYFNDLIITHEDEEYMKDEYEFDLEEDMYFIRCDPKDPRLIEMSFNLTSYQPHLREKNKARNIYQSIFLDDRNTSGWTNGLIQKGKVLKERMTRQFAHTWRHFAFWVPFVRFLQGHRHTYYAGSWTLFNTHEIAVMSGLGAADRLGAPYPFRDDEFAFKQYKTLFKINHGLFTRMTSPASV
jgi:predicted NAD/FAD-binding protein